MKQGIVLIFLILTLSLSASVLFYDDFERADGDVANGWQFNTPPHLTNSLINTGVYNINLPATGNTYHSFTEQTNGTVFVEYDWKVLSNDWTTCVYPVEDMVYIRCDWEGNLDYDTSSNFTTPTPITQINFQQWYHVKLAYDIDNNTFSFWLDDTQLINEVTSNNVSSLNSFYFRNLNATDSIQQIDNFLVYDNTPPLAPLNLTATESVSSIVLNWESVPDSLFVTYKIYRDITPNPTTEIAEVGPYVTTYTDMVRSAPNTDYYYRVKAIGLGDIESDYSEQVELIHLQPEMRITGNPVNIDVGYGYEEAGSFTIHNDGNYDLNYMISTTGNSSLSNGLVAYYPLDGNANDASGYGNNGTVYGATPYTDISGNINSALYFDGDDYAIIPGNFIFHNPGDASISFWMYKEDSNKRNIFWSKNDDFENNRYNFFTGDDGNGFEMDYREPNGTLHLNDGPNTMTTSIQEWVHVVVTRINDTYSFYRNGLLIVEETDASPSLPNTSDFWRI
ncbi:MAG: LamG-like jellyroll fold domain-containing protein, partial [Candidatus Zophobacter franzmannii]|nr:LamG-like jellyroll fold domain-containing protein [Candidatus Zophobacter franzmannii]